MDRSITICATKDTYLIGEPLLLEISYNNIRSENITVPESWIEGDEPPIEILVSGDGIAFTRFRFGYPILEILDRPYRTLKPGASWQYELRLLYTRFHSGRLAFPVAGKYFLKVRKDGAKPKDSSLDSNVIGLKIEEPTGVDAKVWERMQDKQILELIQSARGPKETALAVAALLREFPKSNYRPTLGHALREFYFKQGYSVKPEGKEIRAVLGFEDVGRIADKRLDARIRSFLGQDRTVEDVLRELSLQTGIPVDASPELKTKVVPTSFTIQLRDVLRSISVRLRAPWWPLADGYLLSREPPTAESKSTK
ncbi:MAG: hypothetical protein L0215_13260 [Gemmataceae bacterium]|nr:hypothetical protein [Gemmataceae bacterium]